MQGDRVQRRIDRLLDEAELSADRKAWAEVAALASEVLALDEANVDARGLLTAAERMQLEVPAVPEIPPIPAVVTAPTEPTSFANGRYSVAKFLGEGGKKKVYLAHDSLLDRDVAFALIKTEGLDQVGRERIAREGQAMGRLGAHPHVVTVFDLGETDGQPFMVTELMGGGDVEGLIEKAAGPLAVEQSLEIAKAVCRGLEFAHGKGIVHRDLKPGNVWLTADGVAKIGDYGLAVALDRSRLTVHGMMVGTVSYMPPEQGLGGEVTPKSDLYSLGAMLYEMVTGKPPFVGGDSTGIISQHINIPPVAPSWVTEHCPPSLEAIILNLLRKAPADRPTSASEVLAALEQVDPAQKSASHSQSNILDRLAKGVFVGREKELDRLRKAFDEAIAGHGGLVMLVGEPGIGKTRTTQELETYARMRGATVLWGMTNESAGAPSYWPWLQIGRQWVAGGGVVEDLRLTSETIGELSRIFPPLRQQPNFVEPQADSDPQSAQFRLFDAYATFLGAVAERGPLVIVLDDLHWADASSLQMLQHIARAIGRSRTLIVGNYRDTDITRQSALSESLAALNRESGFERIVLRGLSRDEVANYIRAKAHVEPKREVLDRIYEETEGNAFFLSEVVNLMAEEGTLDKESVSDIAIPDGVREALGRRLNRLSAETNELLQVATVVGREFGYDAVAAMGGRDDNQLLKQIEEALEARVIEEMDRPGRYRFTHAQMQETLLAELSTTRRVRLHGQVGEGLEALAGVRAEERAAQLARHFVEAATLAPRFMEKAVQYSTLAGRQAASQAAYPDAVRHFQAALSQAPDGRVDRFRADLLADSAAAHLAIGDRLASWALANRAFRYYVENEIADSAVRMLELAATYVTVLALGAELEALVREVSPICSPESAELARAYVLEAFTAGLRDDDLAAAAGFSRAHDLAAKLEAPELELNALRLETQHAMIHNEPRVAREKGRRAAELAVQLNVPEIEFQARQGTFFGELWAGHQEAARIEAAAALAVAERLRAPAQIRLALLMSGEIGAYSGDWARVSECRTRRKTLLEPPKFEYPDEGLRAALTGDTAATDAFVVRLQEWADTQPQGPTLARGWVAAMPPSLEYLLGRGRQWPESGKAVQVVATAASKRSVTFFCGTIGAAMHAIADSDAASAKELLPVMERWRDFTGLIPSNEHVRALLLLVVDDVNQAIETFEHALKLQSAGYYPGYAWSAYECARVRSGRSTPGDEERASALMDEALEIAQRLGMKPLIAKIISTREILKA